MLGQFFQIKLILKIELNIMSIRYNTYSCFLYSEKQVLEYFKTFFLYFVQ